MIRLVLLLLMASVIVACDGSKPHVCTVRPSADGKNLLYSPAGCEKHQHDATLNIETAT